MLSVFSFYADAQSHTISVYASGYIRSNHIYSVGGVHSHELCFLYILSRGWMSKDNANNENYYLYIGIVYALGSPYVSAESSLQSIYVFSYGGVGGSNVASPSGVQISL